MAERQKPLTDDRASTGEILMMLFVLTPVTGAVMSGPAMGLTLVTLGVLDSVLILTGLQ